jgi:AcrR family transcriptional regulator
MSDRPAPRGATRRKSQRDRTSRERILDAAGELVSEVGSGRLTLDAVAERAGLSKGGLLYNFPNKDSLLQGMIERLIAEVTAEKESLRGSTCCGRNLEAHLSVSASLNKRCGKMRDIASGLLAASAENPSLLEPARKVIADEWHRLKATSEDVDAAMIAWLAVEGLSNLEMHDLSPVTPEDRVVVSNAIFRLLDRGIAA